MHTVLDVCVVGITMETSHGLLHNSKINQQYRIFDLNFQHNKG